jgi:hypothetical protein
VRTSRWQAVSAAVLMSMLCACSGGGDPLERLPEAELELAGERLPHYPPDGAVAQVNPPGFFWTVKDSAASYTFRLFRKGRDAAELSAEGLSEAALATAKALRAGEYRWFVAYNDSAGRPFGRSRIRTFSLGDSAVALPLPDVAALTREVRGQRPRLFFSPGGELEGLIAARAAGADSAAWRVLISRADAALSEPLYPEPSPYKDGKFEVGEWRRIYTPGKRGSAHAMRLALVWRVTGERKYLEGSRKWLLHLSGWDPDGITSYNLPLPDGSTGNDEASMPMLERMALTYDWIAAELDSTEREVVLTSLRRRGNQMLDYYRRVNFISGPWSNHAVRAIPFLGFAAVSCLGEVEDAGVWLDYVLRCYLTTFPTWGSDDGGWAQGLSYWSAYVGWHTNFLDALRGATGIDLYSKPFFRNNGYFAVYCHPPYARRGGFGDHGEGAPNAPEKLMLLKYAAALNDPVLLWQSEHIAVQPGIQPNLQVKAGEPDWLEWFAEDVFAFLCPKPENLKEKSPLDLPQSKWFRDIGWVAMHSALGDSAQDVWALFKSSRYGSFSHSHADQNSFQFNAYGEPLLIDSGYYPWYGSPHHNLWTRQTRAHNAVLVNGRGQAVYSMEAAGTLEAYHALGGLTVASGEAARAYNTPLEEEIVKQWGELLKEPLPPDSPKVLTARRTLAFRGQGAARPWLAVLDYFEVEGPATFQYMLHALAPFQIDSTGGALVVRQGEAACLVRLICSTDMQFSQNDRFTLPPEERYEGAANQWYFCATTREKIPAVKYLALIVPFRQGEETPRVEMLDKDGWRGFEVNGERVLAWWGEGETGSPAGKVDEKRLLIDWVDGAQKRSELF